MDRPTVAIAAMAFAGVCTALAPAGPPDSGEGAAPTFTQDVAPIIFRNCASCHRPGEVGPFPLLDYDDVRKRAKTIDRVVSQKLMPPWHPVEGHGEFRDELALSSGEIETISKWVEAGMPEGDPKKTPPLPDFVDGWQLGEPDAVVKMPEPFDVPAGGPDIYRNFVIPLGFDDERWLTAIEVRPSARSVLHHVLFFLDETGEARRIDGQDGKPGFRRMVGGGENQLLGADTAGLGGWAVGGMPRHLPMGLARRIPAGADFVLQAHFHPSGKAEREQTTLGLHFTDKAPDRTMAKLQLPPLFGVSAGLDIPAGEGDFKLRDSFEVPVDSEAVLVGGHAHMICAQMQAWITPPGASERESVFWIDRWDFDWQNQYEYFEPLQLPAGTKVDVELTYDNTNNNPHNPFDPPQRIRWGQESTDEMGSVSFLVVAKQESDSAALQAAIRRHGIASMARGAGRSFGGGGGGLLGELVDRLLQYDTNKDGKVSKDEIPQQMRQFVGRLDTDGNGDIDADEIAALKGGAPAPEAKKAPENAAAKPGAGPTYVALDGSKHWPLDPGDRKGNVLIFTTTDCPIANNYAPEINSIVADYAGKPVRIYLVHVDPDTTAESALAHAREYAYACPILLDPKQELAKQLEITVTPQAVVLTPGDKIAYRGRIDDQWGDLQKRRPAPTRRDLRQALDAILAGKPVPTSRTKAVGCNLPELATGE